MKAQDGRLILVAVLVVLAYLIFHPHLQTLWYEYKTSDTPDGPNTAVVAGPPFATYLMCEGSAAQDTFAAKGTASCSPGYSFIWGW